MLHSSVSVPAGDCAVAVARQIGYGRTGATIKDTIEKVIGIMIQKAEIITKNDRIMLPE